MTTHSNRLPTLAAGIRTAHGAVERSAIAAAEHALAAGRMLAEAKALVAHGHWATWLAEHTGISARTASRYMRLARAGLNSATVADLGIAAAADALAKPRFCVPTGAQTAIVQAATARAYLWPAPQHPGFCHVLVFDRWLHGAGGPDFGAEVVTSRRPVRDDALTMFLPHLGVDLARAEIELVDTIGHDALDGFRDMDAGEANNCTVLAGIPSADFESALSAAKAECRGSGAELDAGAILRHVGGAA